MPSRKSVTFKEGVSFSSDTQTERTQGTDRNDAEGSREGRLPTVEELKPKGQHSLDSDEEEEAGEEKLGDSDIEGEEEETIRYDEGVEIMPFNMKEEMQTGHFDKTGTYIFDKEDDLQDGWLENVDWNSVKKRESENEKKSSGGRRRKADGDNDDDNDSDDDDDEPDPLSVIDLSEMKPEEKCSIFKQMAELMKPGETVVRAIRRLGGGKVSLSQRWKAKKRQKTPADAEESSSKRDDAEKGRKDMLALTGLADKLVQVGELEIYENTYETLLFKCGQANPLIAGGSSEGLAGKSLGDTATEDDDELAPLPAAPSTVSESKPSEGRDDVDMFSMDDEETADSETSATNNTAASASSTDAPVVTVEAPVTTSVSIGPSKSDEIGWMYKWEGSGEEGEIYGPYSSSAMLEWSEGGFFDAGAQVRKEAATDGQWYSSKRIDFDIYT